MIKHIDTDTIDKVKTKMNQVYITSDIPHTEIKRCMGIVGMLTHQSTIIMNYQAIENYQINSNINSMLMKYDQTY